MAMRTPFTCRRPTALPFLLSLVLLWIQLAHVIPPSSAIKWENCGPADSPVTVQSAVMNPDPAVSGQNFTLLLPSRTDTPLDSGSVAIYVYYWGIPVYISSEGLCSRIPCPIPAGGSFTFENSQALPSVTPAGNYVLWLKATATDGSVLFCSKVSFRIARPKSLFSGPRSGMRALV